MSATRGQAQDDRDLRLRDGSTVAVVGGGPAGSFFSTFLLRLARRRGLELALDVYEPRNFSERGPGNCNMCGGVVSESLIQHLAGEGINLPSSVIQRRIDSYSLHMDVGTVRIATPLEEKRIAAVHRSSGPRTFAPLNSNSFDAFLLQHAVDSGARIVPERVTSIGMQEDRPQVGTKTGQRDYDFLAVSVGINSGILKMQDNGADGYIPPKGTKTYICEFHIGHRMVKRYLGSSMHIFLLDLPQVEFAALIPKSDYVTVCLLGTDIDKDVVRRFLASTEVKECMPPLWEPPDQHCHCAPKINVGSAVRPFADRAVFIGDCATTRLYKDGIGAAYRTSKAAAVTAVFDGISAESFRKKYWPVCKAIQSDNDIGKLMFAAGRQFQRRPRARRAVWQTLVDEQVDGSANKRLSLVMWDLFTGSASYRSVAARSLHPKVWGTLARNLIFKRKFGTAGKKRRRIPMATGMTGALGKQYKDGDVIFNQGETGDCMFVIQRGGVELVQREGNQEFVLRELGKGDFFGEMALFEPLTRPVTARAVGHSWIYTLERDTLLKRIHEDPSLAFRLIQQLAYRVRELERSLIKKSRVAM